MYEYESDDHLPKKGDIVLWEYVINPLAINVTPMKPYIVKETILNASYVEIINDKNQPKLMGSIDRKTIQTDNIENAKPGDKVICINIYNVIVPKLKNGKIKLGEVYTVKKVNKSTLLLKNFNYAYNKERFKILKTKQEEYLPQQWEDFASNLQDIIENNRFEPSEPGAGTALTDKGIKESNDCILQFINDHEELAYKEIPQEIYNWETTYMKDFEEALSYLKDTIEHRKANDHKLIKEPEFEYPLYKIYKPSMNKGTEYELVIKFTDLKTGEVIKSKDRKIGSVHHSWIAHTDPAWKDYGYKPEQEAKGEQKIIVTGTPCQSYSDPSRFKNDSIDAIRYTLNQEQNQIKEKIMNTDIKEEVKEALKEVFCNKEENKTVSKQVSDFERKPKYLAVYFNSTGDKIEQRSVQTKEEGKDYLVVLQSEGSINAKVTFYKREKTHKIKQQFEEVN